MKQATFYVLVAGLLSFPMCSGLCSTPELLVGDNADAVQAILGEPQGYIKTPSVELFLYVRGTVEARQGKVTAVNLVSEKEAEARREAREIELKSRQAALAARRERLRTEGLALKEKKLRDPVFLSSPPSDQLEFWREFRKRFPGVSVGEEFAHALARWEEQVAREQVEAKEAKKAAELEKRLLAMEKRVREAEDRARRAEDKAEVRSRGYTYVSYGAPVIWYPHHRLRCRRTAKVILDDGIASRLSHSTYHRAIIGPSFSGTYETHRSPVNLTFRYQLRP